MKKVKFLSAILSIAFSAGLVFSVPSPIASAFDSFEELKSHFQQQAQTFTVDLPATEALESQLETEHSVTTTFDVSVQPIMDRYAELFKSKNRGCCRHCAAFYFKALEELKQKGIVQQNYQLDIRNLSSVEGHVANLYKKDNQWYVADFMLASAIEEYKRSNPETADAVIGGVDPFQMSVENYASLDIVNMKIVSMAILREYEPRMKYKKYKGMSNTVDIRDLLPEKKAILDRLLNFTFNPETKIYNICSNSPLGRIQDQFNFKKLAWTQAPVSPSLTESLSNFRENCSQMWTRSRGNGYVAASAISTLLTAAGIKNYEIKIPAKNGQKARIINLYNCYGEKWYVADFAEARMNHSRDFFNVYIREYLLSYDITVDELLVFNKDAATVDEYQTARPIRDAAPELAAAIDRALAR